MNCIHVSLMPCPETDLCAEKLNLYIFLWMWLSTWMQYDQEKYHAFLCCCEHQHHSAILTTNTDMIFASCLWFLVFVSKAWLNFAYYGIGTPKNNRWCRQFREAQENKETIVVIVTTILQILVGMAGFQENRLYTSLQVILYSLSPQKKSPTCLHVQSPASVHSALIQ